MKKLLAKMRDFCYNLFLEKERRVYMPTSLSVANNILNKAFEDKVDITPMKLQKLLYLLYARYLHMTNGRRLFSSSFEVWEYGPVNSEVYRYFRGFGKKSIDSYALEDGEANVINENGSPVFSECLNLVWNKYKNYSGPQLSYMTHEKDTAWYNAKERNEQVITNEQEIRRDGETFFV